jgi:predicted O-linked N-acetylglucosamine transferase (SPINDLY family)
MACDSPEQFVARAIEFAGDLQQAATLRRELRPRMADSILCNAPAFVGRLEAAYREIWRNYRGQGG